MDIETHATRPVLLSQAREAAGLHIEALAAALKVPVKKLEALEAGRYEELPDLVFARALASSACRQLKMDPAPILLQIPAGVTPVLGDAGMAINAPFKSTSGGASAHSAGWLSHPAVLAAMALMMGALVLVFLPYITPLAESIVSAPVVDASPGESPAPAPSAADEASAMAAAAQVSREASADSSQTPVAVPPVSKTAVTAPGVPQPAEVTPSTGDTVDNAKVLAIRATGESWVEVANGNGVVVVQRLLKAGDLVDFSAAPPYSVVVGRVDNAEVQVRGRTFDTTPFARNGVARFEVK